MPTTLATVGVPIPLAVPGRNLFDESLKPQTAIFAAQDRCRNAFDQIRCVRTKQFKYIRNFEPQRLYTTISSYKKLSHPVLTLLEVPQEQGQLTRVQNRFLRDSRPAEELYDLRNDPYETINLTNDLSYAAPFRVLKRVLSSKRCDIVYSNGSRTHDEGLTSEGDSKYEAAILAEKQTWYEKTMKRRKLNPISPIKYTSNGGNGSWGLNDLVTDARCFLKNSEIHKIDFGVRASHL